MPVDGVNGHPYRASSEPVATAPQSRDLPIAPHWKPTIPSDTPEAICAGGIPFQGRRIHIDVAVIGAEIVVCRECGAMWAQTGVK